MIPQYIIIKAPIEQIAVNLDFTTIVNSGTVSISGLSISFNPSDNILIPIASSIYSGTQSGYITISGGTDNINYRLRAGVLTSDNEYIINEGIIKVRDI